MMVDGRADESRVDRDRHRYRLRRSEGVVAAGRDDLRIFANRDGTRDAVWAWHRQTHRTAPGGGRWRGNPHRLRAAQVEAPDPHLSALPLLYTEWERVRHERELTHVQ